MGMAFEVDPIHVEGFALLPVRPTEQAIQRRHAGLALSGKKHLQANFAHGIGTAVGHFGHGDQVIEADKTCTRAFVVAPLTLQIIKAVTFQRSGNHRQEQ